MQRLLADSSCVLRTAGQVQPAGFAQASATNKLLADLDSSSDRHDPVCMMQTLPYRASPSPPGQSACTGPLLSVCCRAATAPEPATAGGGGGSALGGSGPGGSSGGGKKTQLGGDEGPSEEPGSDEEYLSLSEVQSCGGCAAACLTSLAATSSSCLSWLCVQAELLASTSGVQLPPEFITAAESGGLRKVILDGYINLQVRASHACHSACLWRAHDDIDISHGPVLR